MKAEVNVAKATQSAVEIMGQKEKTLYYLVIETAKGKVSLNVGEKTYNSVTALEPVTQAQIFPPEQGKK